MGKSEYTKNLDRIQAEALKYLNQLGYKKKGRTFNKTLDSGLIHVINFQMGRRSLSGKFTINLGVYIPEIYKLLWFWIEDEPKFVDHGDCEITERIGFLAPSSKSLWWDLKKNPRRLNKNVVMHIDNYGLPYLNRFMNQDDIINEWKLGGEQIGFTHRANLSIAILLANSGKRGQARNLLIQECESNMNKPYAEFVLKIANKLDINLENG